MSEKLAELLNSKIGAATDDLGAFFEREGRNPYRVGRFRAWFRSFVRWIRR